MRSLRTFYFYCLPSDKDKERTRQTTNKRQGKKIGTKENAAIKDKLTPASGPLQKKIRLQNKKRKHPRPLAHCKRQSDQTRRDTNAFKLLLVSNLGQLRVRGRLPLLARGGSGARGAGPRCSGVPDCRSSQWNCPALRALALDRIWLMLMPWLRAKA